MLYLILYLLDVVKTINNIVGVITFVLGGVLLLLNFFCRLDELTGDDAMTSSFGKWLNRKTYTFYAICTALFIALPSQKTIVLMSGVYVGNQVVERVEANPLVEKAIKLIERKLDDLADANQGG